MPEISPNSSTSLGSGGPSVQLYEQGISNTQVLKAERRCNLHEVIIESAVTIEKELFKREQRQSKTAKWLRKWETLTPGKKNPALRRLRTFMEAKTGRSALRLNLNRQWTTSFCMPPPSPTLARHATGAWAAAPLYRAVSAHLLNLETSWRDAGCIHQLTDQCSLISPWMCCQDLSAYRSSKLHTEQTAHRLASWMVSADACYSRGYPML